MRAFSKVKTAVVGAAVTVAISAGAAFASPVGMFVDYQFSQYTGNSGTVDARITQTDAHTLTFNLNQVGNAGSLSASVGEFRAFYFSVADASLLSGVTIAGTGVTATTSGFGAVTQIAGDNDTKMNGGSPCSGSGCLFDVGIAFGTAGRDNAATSSTSFTYARANGVDLGTFFDATGAIMGARLKSFSDGGASKDACAGGAITPHCLITSSSSSSSTSGSGSSSGPGGQGGGVPEPAALGLFGAGLLGLGLMRRRRECI